MTVKELYEYLKEQGKENYKIGIQYRDYGRAYHGFDNHVYVRAISDENKLIII